MKLNKRASKKTWMYVVPILVVIILIGLFFVLREDKSSFDPSTLELQEFEDDAILGDPDAPITIIEFSDYECPFCGRFYLGTLPELKRTYIDSGKAKLIFRDFPLGFHKDAQKAAEATEVARALGGDEKFWEMHDKLFENQDALGVSNLKQYARDIGLDGESFDYLIDSGYFSDEVREDLIAGQQAGVSGTPSFFINGQALVGAQPFSEFERIIEGELNN